MGNTTSVIATIGHQTAIVAITGHQTAIVATVKHQTTIAISTAVPLTATPSSVAFYNSTESPISVSLSHGAAASYTASTSSAGTASAVVSASSVVISPVSPGAALITVTGSDGSSVVIPVMVGAVAGALTVSVASLLLVASGGATTQSFTASRTLDNKPISARSVPPGFVTITGGGNAPGPVTFTAATSQVGTGSIVVSAADGTSITIPVVSYGPLFAFVASHHASRILTVSVGKQNYNGAFSAVFVGANNAKISPAIGYGPSQIYTITDTIPGELYLFEVASAYDTVPIQLTIQTRDISLGPVSVTFFDETGTNPLPPGVGYDVYYDGDAVVSASQGTAATPSTVIFSGFLGLNGATSVPLEQNTSYIVVFNGLQAPTVRGSFMSGATTAPLSVNVGQYRSPNFSQVGYADVIVNALWTRGWISNSSKLPGSPGQTSNAYNLAYGLSSLPQVEDQRIQTVSLATRLDQCSGNQPVSTYAVDPSNPNKIITTITYVDQLASFAADFFAGTLSRQAGEDDPTYRARIKSALAGTYPYVVVQAGTPSGYFEGKNPPGKPLTILGGITSYASILSNAQSAWNSLGNTGTITIFDIMGSCFYDTVSTSQTYQKYVITPLSGTAFATYASALALVAPQFCLLLPNSASIGDTFFSDKSYANQNSYLIPLGVATAISPLPTSLALVSAAVDARRASGTIPIYAQVQH